MRGRVLLVITATLALAACSESSTAPRTMRPGARTSDEITCRSGYHIATRADGTQYCEEDVALDAMSGTRGTTASRPAVTSTR